MHRQPQRQQHNMLDVQQLTTSANLPWVLIITFVGMAMMTMVVLLIHQQRTINHLEAKLRPKYGFLGKPLYSIFGVMVLIGGFAVSYYAGSNIAPVQTLADKNVQVIINTRLGSRENGLTSVTFGMIPVVDNGQWGTVEDEYVFDVFWTITGPQTISQPEISLTRLSPGGFVKRLPSGTYSVKVVLVFDDRNWTQESNLIVP